MSNHLGYDKHALEGREGGNSRNGTRSKTVLTEIGPVEITSRGTGPGRSSRRRSANVNVVSRVSTRW